MSVGKLWWKQSDGWAYMCEKDQSMEFFFGFLTICCVCETRSNLREWKVTGELIWGDLDPEKWVKQCRNVVVREKGSNRWQKSDPTGTHLGSPLNPYFSKSYTMSKHCRQIRKTFCIWKSDFLRSCQMSRSRVEDQANYEQFLNSRSRIG